MTTVIHRSEGEWNGGSRQKKSFDPPTNSAFASSISSTQVEYRQVVVVGRNACKCYYTRYAARISHNVSYGPTFLLPSRRMQILPRKFLALASSRRTATTTRSPPLTNYTCRDKKRPPALVLDFSTHINFYSPSSPCCLKWGIRTLFLFFFSFSVGFAVDTNVVKIGGCFTQLFPPPFIPALDTTDTNNCAWV